MLTWALVYMHTTFARLAMQFDDAKFELTGAGWMFALSIVADTIILAILFSGGVVIR